MKTRTFIDQVTIDVKAGRGGDGSGSFRREAHVPEGGPDGGDGGRGGHVILRADSNTDSLVQIFFSNRLFAENGVSGSGQKMHGRNGEDLLVRVPCGTEVYNVETETFIGEVLTDGEECIIAKAGNGGWGNVHFKSSVNQAPERFNPGQEGEAFRARLELKTIADVGLVGFPNAGKSSFLSRVSDARPKIASYPFTTIHPIVGTVTYSDFSRLRVADVPGIIEGAASGVGLGITFLKHIARSRLLLFVIDMAGTDNRQPWEDYKTLLAEIEQYDAALLSNPSLVIANKMDQDEALENLPRFVQETGVNPIQVSMIDETHPGIEAVKDALHVQLKPVPLGTFGTSKRNSEKPSIILNDDFDDFDVITPERLAMATFLDLGSKKK